MDNATPNTMDGSSDNNQLVVIGLVILGIYLIMRNRKKVVPKETNPAIDSFSKFLTTPMGKSVGDQLYQEGTELSAYQILMVDKCLQNLDDEENKVLLKASQFAQKPDLYKALSDEEMKKFIPVRRKIMDCVDEVLTR
jgi:hypothetical protein